MINEHKTVVLFPFSRVKSQRMTNLCDVHTFWRINNSVIWSAIRWSCESEKVQGAFEARFMYGFSNRRIRGWDHERETQKCPRERERGFVSAAATELTFYLLPAQQQHWICDRAQQILYFLCSLSGCRLVFCLARAHVSNIKHWRRAVQLVWVGK